ncbi:MAG: Hsp20/alpha crystallin family protein [Deltaproteobacteria bacterium]|nr:Hsp20/alpha crystallin family protein [Deltaproteobacteria bacterium]MBW2150165.1 Hsp20/alpha crystallin family protein [Deltaproteobacteria bacterium]
MMNSGTKEIKVRGKQEASTPVEQTKPGLVFTPHVDIFETDKEITLLADLPGVKPENLHIDLRENVLTLSTDAEPDERPGEEDIMVEYETGKYYRQFNLSEIIDQNKIDAKLNNGVLKLMLPKVEKAAPRKIEIKTE